MSSIPGYPLSALLALTENDQAAVPDPSVLLSLLDADVIIGRNLGSLEEFIVFGREVLQRVAVGEDVAEGYNVLCIEIDQHAMSNELDKLLALVESVKGRHEFIGSEPE